MSSYLNLLLADDASGDVKIVQRAFEESKYPTKVTVVNGGEAVLSYLKRAAPYSDAAQYPWPDMILMDIRMPGMDGFETLQAIRKEPELREIPVVMMSTAASEEDVFRSYKLGAVSFIQKPFEFEKFREMVDGFNLYWHSINKLPSRKESRA